MELQTWIVLIIELIGTVAFSVSGAMVGMRKQMDIFGVIVLGVVTAVGGGMMRDVFLGQIPGAFTKPVYVEAAVVSAVIPFVLLYVNKKLLHSRYQIVYTKIIFLMDSLGLGIFTAMGVSTGVGAGYEKNKKEQEEKAALDKEKKMQQAMLQIKKKYWFDRSDGTGSSSNQ